MFERFCTDFAPLYAVRASWKYSILSFASSYLKWASGGRISSLRKNLRMPKRKLDSARVQSMLVTSKLKSVFS